MAVVRTLMIIITLLLGWATVRTDALAHVIAAVDSTQG
jgi:hypothetical protein